MKNTGPLLWNTLDEAAEWLSQMRGETWTAKNVIDVALALRDHKQGATPRPTLISAALSHGCTYGVYVWDAAKGSPADPFVPKLPGAVPATNPVPLYCSHLGDILLRGKTEISMLQSPESPDGIEGEYHFVEPFDKSVEVTVDMLGVSGRNLTLLAKLLPDASKEAPGVKSEQVSDVSWDAMADDEKKEAWSAMTPERRQAKAAELVKKHSGNKSAAGREVGISGKRIAQLLKKSNLEAPLPVKSNTGPFGLPQPKRSKASS